MVVPVRKSRPVARLALEDGTIYEGVGFGACEQPRTVTGEVVFNTAMCGYQEALTDPSYAGQILSMTATEIGNYGVCDADVESGRPQVAGFVVRELSRIWSNHRARTGLSEWLGRAGILAIEGLDTRALVRRLRLVGAMRGALSIDSSLTAARLVEIARTSPPMAGRNLASEVAPKQAGRFGEGLGEWTNLSPQGGERWLAQRAGEGRTTTPHPALSPPGGERRGCGLHVVALDCGAKRNIYRHLVERGCVVEFLPHDVSADEIRSRRPDGLLISNGPGDPAAIDLTVVTLREIAGEVPTFGICLGHQLLALALGAKTYKLKFGHRGANQPVRNLLSGRVEITSQNHGFCVDRDSLGAIDLEETHVHLNDGTLAGFRHRSRPIFSVQYHPEASPGPHDSGYLFDCFIEMMRSKAPLDPAAVSRAQRAACSPRPEGPDE